MRTRSAKALGAVAMLSAAAMLFAGCAAGNTAPSATDSPAAALPTVDWDAADAADVQDGGTRSGFLVGLDRDINQNFRLGVGYNFTDFSDDLTNFDYDHPGWFLNLVGTY